MKYQLRLLAAAALIAVSSVVHAAHLKLFPLQDVRLGASPFLEAQQTDLHYMMEMEPDRLLAPFLREAGLSLKKPTYGNWESSGSMATWAAITCRRWR